MSQDLEADIWAREKIQAAGLRTTHARVSTLSVIRDSSRPLTHAEVYENLSELGFDKATVYRNLKDLVRANLLRRTELGDCVWRFEMISEEGQTQPSSQNFLCIDCGSISSMQRVNLTKASQELMKSLGSVQEILLRGHCHDCA